jgi:hypothetical protein
MDREHETVGSLSPLPMVGVAWIVGAAASFAVLVLIHGRPTAGEFEEWLLEWHLVFLASLMSGAAASIGVAGATLSRFVRITRGGQLGRLAICESVLDAMAIVALAVSAPLLVAVALGCRSVVTSPSWARAGLIPLVLEGPDAAWVVAPRLARGFSVEDSLSVSAAVFGIGFAGILLARGPAAGRRAYLFAAANVAACLSFSAATRV